MPLIPYLVLVQRCPGISFCPDFQSPYHLWSLCCSLPLMSIPPSRALPLCWPTPVPICFSVYFPKLSHIGKTTHCDFFLDSQHRIWFVAFSVVAAEEVLGGVWAIVTAHFTISTLPPPLKPSAHKKINTVQIREPYLGRKESWHQSSIKNKFNQKDT